MKHLQRRLKNLEAVLTDSVGLMPHTRKWLEYWDRQWYAYMTYREVGMLRSSDHHVYEAVMKYADESPASLVGSIPPHADDPPTLP